VRAAATVYDPRRRDRATARARRRHDARPDETLPFAFRIRAWPPWAALDDNGDPLLDGDHELVLVERPGIEVAPDRQDPYYQQTLRDAQLLAGLWPHADLDGRTTMAQHGTDYDLDDASRRARPGPYHPPAGRRARAEPRDLRLAQLAGMPLATIKRLTPQLRDELLEHYTNQRAEQRRAERHALAARLADFGSVDRGVEPGADA
jgi:hypothetical protein